MKLLFLIILLVLINTYLDIKVKQQKDENEKKDKK